MDVQSLYYAYKRGATGPKPVRSSARTRRVDCPVSYLSSRPSNYLPLGRHLYRSNIGAYWPPGGLGTAPDIGKF